MKRLAEKIRCTENKGEKMESLEYQKKRSLG